MLAPMAQNKKPGREAGFFCRFAAANGALLVNAKSVPDASAKMRSEAAWPDRRRWQHLEDIPLT